MAIKNTLNTYGSVAKFFHWIIALFVIVLLIVGFTAVNFMTDEAAKTSILGSHKLFGLLVLCLAVLRLLWRWMNVVPLLPMGTPLWEKILEETVKFGLYAVLFLMPLSGWLFTTAAGHPPRIGDMVLAMPFVPESKPLAEQFVQVHHFFAFFIVGLLVLHIAGAIKHHFINRDDVLRRMLPRFRS